MTKRTRNLLLFISILNSKMTIFVFSYYLSYKKYKCINGPDVSQLLFILEVIVNVRKKHFSTDGSKLAVQSL